MFSNTSTAQNVPTRMRKLVTLVTAAAATGASFPAFANNDHNDLFSCYAYVHEQCFKNGEDVCGDDNYQWGLDQCDGHYPSVSPRPGGLVTPGAGSGPNMTTRDSLMTTD